MKYADEQIVRPKIDGHGDYGHGRRSVLVRNGKRDLLHVAGQKHWSGNYAPRNYSPAELVLWDGDGKDFTERSVPIHEGRTTPAVLAERAEAIFKHLKKRFPIELISLRHTLLLDVPGDVDGPPARPPRKPPTPSPRLESAKLYKIAKYDVDSTSPDELRLVVYRVLSQSRGKVTYDRLIDGKPAGRGHTERIDRLAEGQGIYASVAAAKEAHVADIRRRVEEAHRAAQKSADRLAESRRELIDAHVALSRIEEPSDGA